MPMSFAPYHVHILKVVYLYLIVNWKFKCYLTNTGSELQPRPVTQQYFEHRCNKSFQAPAMKISLIIGCS